MQIATAQTTKSTSSLEAITNAASCRKYSISFLYKNKWFDIYVDNHLVQTISQTQNRAAKDKKTPTVDVQTLWTPLNQLGEQLSLALVFKSK